MAVQLDERFWSKVNKDAPNGCWEWTASKVHNGYGQFKLDRRMQYAHRVSWAWSRGEIPEGMQLDHICWSRSCVNPDHLRLATQGQNLQNRPGAQANSMSGVRGVHWHKARQRWMARAKMKGHCHYLGLFDTVAEAEAAVVAWRREHMPYSEMDKAA